MFAQMVFYLFSGMLLLSAAMTVTVRNPVYAALFLVLSFFSMAAIWLLLLAEFLAIVLVLVYVGAVMVLFLFVVMLLDINITVLREGFARYLPVGLCVAVLMAVVMVSPWWLDGGAGGATSLAASPQAPDVSNTALLGQTLFTVYLYQFEIAGALLLVAIIAAISLCLQIGRPNKAVDPRDQVEVSKQDRLRVVSMPAERPEDGP